MSATGRALWKALSTPSDWTIDKYCIHHKPTGMSFWMANGGFFFDGSDIDGTPECIGLIERHWLHMKAKWMQNRKIAERFASKAKP